jgi:hypothetical protein
MEPERNIEKKLRAYAKKRREQAGDPLTLHPATRRLLHGEIARKPVAPDKAEDSLSLWELLRQQWAFLLSFALVVFFAATMFLPALSSAKKKAQSISAMANLKQIGELAYWAAEKNNGKLPASLDVLTNEPGSDKILTDPQSSQPFIYVAGGENLNDLPDNAVLAYSPTDKKGRAVLFADGSVAMINGAQFSQLTNRQLSELALAKDSTRQQFTEITNAVALGNATALPISAPLKSDSLEAVVSNTGDLAVNKKPAAPATIFDDRSAVVQGAVDNHAVTQANAVEFGFVAAQKLLLSPQNAFKNSVESAKPSVVLANFQVQQNGSAIRVVDADGSIYDGALQSENADLPIAVPDKVELEKSRSNRNESQIAANYFFRVTGMNQTLKQNVVFAGNLLAISNTPTTSPQLSGGNGNSSGAGFGGGQLQAAITNQLPWSNSRITGTATIADTNRVEINAVPQAR